MEPQRFLPSDHSWSNNAVSFNNKVETREALKDRLGDQRGGSEWEPIKILLEGD
jgi:hypothetical protein